MGLLNQILGGIARGAAAGSPRMRSGANPVLMALLPVVLSMLSRRAAGSLRGGGLTGSPGGGLSGGGLSGGGLGRGLGGLGALGGLAGILSLLSQRGFGGQVNSWVGTGPNEPLSPDVLGDVFDRQQIAEIASQAGVSEDEARSGLAELLPQVVDDLTPDGQLPPDDQLDERIEQFQRQLYT